MCTCYFSDVPKFLSFAEHTGNATLVKQETEGDIVLLSPNTDVDDNLQGHVATEKGIMTVGHFGDHSNIF